MDPLVEALINKYQMRPDLAQRVAAGLRSPNGAANAYPLVADQLAAPQAPAPVADSPAQVEPGYDYEALKKNYPAAFHADIDKVARAYGPNPGRVLKGEGDQVLRLVQQRFEVAQKGGTQSTGGLTKQDEEFNRRQRRVAMFKELVQKAKRGDDIGEDNRKWLQAVDQRVQENTKPTKHGSTFLNSPLMRPMAYPPRDY